MFYVIDIPRDDIYNLLFLFLGGAIFLIGFWQYLSWHYLTTHVVKNEKDPPECSPPQVLDDLLRLHAEEIVRQINAHVEKCMNPPDNKIGDITHPSNHQIKEGDTVRFLVHSTHPLSPHLYGGATRKVHGVFPKENLLMMIEDAISVIPHEYKYTYAFLSEVEKVPTLLTPGSKVLFKCDSTHPRSRGIRKGGKWYILGIEETKRVAFIVSDYPDQSSRVYPAYLSELESIS